ncbi:MAG: tetratricopeptide repeat protein [Acidobacteriota bacterium]|nr:tetratricopeptide repeat protein [Acidobacteriota bacterium]
MRLKTISILIICLNIIFCASSQKKIEQAREKDPRYQCNLGLVYLNNGKVDLAIDYFNKSLSLLPNYELALNAMGIAYSMKGNFEESAKYYEKCLKVNPSLTETHNYLGTAYQQMGFLDKAEEQFQQAAGNINYKSRELPYYNLARLYFLQDKPKKALEYIEKSLALNNTLVMALNLKGLINDKLENYEEAINCYNQALKIAPDDLNLNFNLAVAYYKNSQFKSARDIFELISAKTTDPEMKKKVEQFLNALK